MASLPTSETSTGRTTSLGFRTPAGRPIAAPEEWSPALIEVELPPEDRHHVRLTRQGAALPTFLKSLDGQERILAEWPRSSTGHYSLYLQVGDLSEEQLVTITPRKLSPEAFSRLLDDLENQLPAAVALGLQRTGALAGIRLLSPKETTRAQELTRLRRAVLGVPGRSGLAAVLETLAHGPHQVLRTSEQWVRADHARRPHPVQLAIAMAQGRDLDAGGRPSRVLDTRVEQVVDVYENRIVCLFHHVVDHRLRRLWRVLERDRRPAGTSHIRPKIPIKRYVYCCR